MTEWFKIFFTNIWNWFVQNKDGITAFFMSGQAISFVAAVVMLIKNLKSVRENTSSTDKLDKTLTNTNEMSGSIRALDENFIALKNENDGLRSQLKETEKKICDENLEIKNKLNAIIEVQAIVYSTIRDDGVRQTVNTILNNARYSDKNFKESLETKIDELEASYIKEFEHMNKHVTSQMELIKSSLNAADEAAKVMEKRNTNVRY